MQIPIDLCDFAAAAHLIQELKTEQRLTPAIVQERVTAIEAHLAKYNFQGPRGALESIKRYIPTTGVVACC